MSYVTGILLVTTLTAIRWHFWEGRKDSLWRTRNATIRNSNQLETAIGAFVCFNLHQWSLVYLMFFLACWKWPHGGCQKTAFNLIDNTSTGLEQRSSDAKPMAIGWIRDEFLILSDFLHLVNSMLPFRDFQQRTSEGRDWLTNNQGFAALTSVRLVKWLETMTRAVTRSKAVEVTATFFFCFGRCLGCKNGTKLLQNPTTSAGSEGFGNCTLVLQWDWKNLTKRFVFKSLRVSSYLCFLYDGAIFWRTANPFGQRQSTFGCQIVRYMPIVRCSREQSWGPMFPKQTTR